MLHKHIPYHNDMRCRYIFKLWSPLKCGSCRGVPLNATSENAYSIGTARTAEEFSPFAAGLNGNVVLWCDTAKIFSSWVLKTSRISCVFPQLYSKSWRRVERVTAGGSNIFLGEIKEFCVLWIYAELSELETSSPLQQDHCLYFLYPFWTSATYGCQTKWVNIWLAVFIYHLLDEPTQ